MLKPRSGAQTPVERANGRDVWVFGYGSLVWHPAFPHVERRAGWVAGWRRRFWQGSTDHRGTPGAPGRVVTLVRGAGDTRCWGMAYRLDPSGADEVLTKLDYRERGGYERVEIALHFDAAPSVSGTMYVATVENANYLGPASLEEIARQVAASRGPSGENVEYVVKLARMLSEICPGLSPESEEALALAPLVEAAQRAGNAGS